MNARTLSLVGVLVLVLFEGPVAADDTRPKFDPDFYFDFAKCRISGAALTQPYSKNDGFIDMKTRGYQVACQRKGKRVMECLTAFEDERAKPVLQDMKMIVESNAMLVLESENGGDFINARPATGLVVALTRVVDEKSLAVKICHGTYLTADEFRAMSARSKRNKPTSE